MRSEEGPGDDALLRAGPAELAPLARSVRDEHGGRRVTFSPEVTVHLAGQSPRAGACTTPGARTTAVGEAHLSAADVLEVARLAVASGCHAVRLCLCGGLGAYRDAGPGWLEVDGHPSALDYVVALADAVLEKSGLLVHVSAGVPTEAELAALRHVSAGQELTVDVGAGAAPGGGRQGTAHQAGASLDAAGRLQIPLTVRLLAAGEGGGARAGRLAWLRAITASHATHGHVQGVLVERPGPGPGCRADPSATDDPELAWTIATARLVLPFGVHVGSRPAGPGEVAAVLGAGADDLGGHCPADGPAARGALEAAVEAAGQVLAPRLPVHPTWALDPGRWLGERLRFPVLDHADAEGLARDSSWVAGGEAAPPSLVGEPALRAARRHRGDGLGRVGEILTGVRRGEVPGEDELVALFEARGDEVAAIAAVADELRKETVGDTVTFVVNRNINYTNICTFKCRFCAFSKGPRSLDLRGEPYLLDLDEVTRRVVEAEALGATEVCLQGGIHPRFDGEYYLEVLRAVRAGSERIHVHGFSALEVTEGARRLGEDLETYLTRLRDAGLGSLPGTAAEILDDEIRAVLCPGKLRTEEWLETHRLAHRVGLRSTVTIMFGAVEQPRHWARHLLATRDLQRETGGFTELVPLPFVHMATPLYRQRRSRRGPTFREVLLVHAVGRIAYHGLVPNVQASWVKTGVEGLRQLLQAGCNDAGGTLVDESIARSAGAAAQPMMTPEDFRDTIEPLGRRVEERTTLYGRPGVPA